jgi:mannose-6-phosphate isomerase-like protein (cupin superfamily)
MLIQFSDCEEKLVHGLRGGQGIARVRQYVDQNNRILQITLAPCASIGMHTHETDSETLMILSGCGTMFDEEGSIPAPTGSVHYCPKGAAHSLRNTGTEDLVLFAVIPTHP